MLKLYKDGNQWCFANQKEIPETPMGFGDTRREAIVNYLIDMSKLHDRNMVDLKTRLISWTIYKLKGDRKLCNCCGNYKEPKEFYMGKNYKEGLSTYCKDCSKKINKSNYLIRKAKNALDTLKELDPINEKND